MMTYLRVYTCCLLLGWLALTFATASDQEPAPKPEELSQGQYTLTRTPPPAHPVLGADVKTVAQRHFTGYQSVQETDFSPWGDRIRLIRANDTQAEVAIAVYATVDEAEMEALQLLNDMSALFERAEPSTGPAGDSSNYWTYHGGHSSTAVFLRKNALVYVHAYAPNAPEEIRSLSAAIDQDLMAGGGGVVLAQSPEPAGPGAFEFVSPWLAMLGLPGFAAMPGILTACGLRSGLAVN